MDGVSNVIQPDELYQRLGTARAPIIIDIRHRDDFNASDRLIVSAIRPDPDEQGTSLPGRRPIVVYGADGRDASEAIAMALGRAGRDVAHLHGGMATWLERGLPTRRKTYASTRTWVTRERPKIDRIACPWLIRRFIDPNAEFVYVPPANVRAVAAQTGAVPFDIEGVEFSHEGDRCSFDTFLRIYDIHDPPLDRLATIVRGADTSRHDLAAQCGGLFAISLGLSANFPNDHEMLAHGMTMYDALYVWCRSLQSETHNWPAKTPPAS